MDILFIYRLFIYIFITFLGKTDEFLSSLFHKIHIFLDRQLDFSSEPGVANEILENEPKSCLVLWLIFTRFSENKPF